MTRNAGCGKTLRLQADFRSANKTWLQSGGSALCRCVELNSGILLDTLAIFIGRTFWSTILARISGTNPSGSGLNINANEENDPLVSVLIPVFNAEMYIVDSINSILAQSYKILNWLFWMMLVLISGKDCSKLHAKTCKNVHYFENTVNKDINWVKEYIG